MSGASELSRRIDVIERGYEYLLAYAAQGRADDAGSQVRETLADMSAALGGLDVLVSIAIPATGATADAAAFVAAVRDDCLKARGAIALVQSRTGIASLLIDNLNASIHLRALLTDLFLLEQALKSPAR